MPKAFRFYIIDNYDSAIKGTNDSELARHYSEEGYLVIDAVENTDMLVDEPIKEAS